MLIDPNPILDDGSPTSTGGIVSAMNLCKALGVPFVVRKALCSYERGWGFEGRGSVPVICAWSVTVQDEGGQTTSFDFDLFDDDSPLLIGLDLKRYSNTDNMEGSREFKFKRPTDNGIRAFKTYMTGTSPMDARLRVRLCEIPSWKKSSAMSSVAAPTRPSTLVKRFHRLTHANVNDTKRFMSEGGCMNNEIEEEIVKVNRSCEICARSGQPAQMKKVSLSHINQAFNQEVQLDYTYCEMRDKKHVVLHIVDAGTAYSETAIVPNRSMETAVSTIEVVWLNRHGTPKVISADDEFDATVKKKLGAFLRSRGIEFKARPVRRHNKLGIAERKHRTLKNVLERLQHDHSEASNDVLLSRATFLSNVFAGSHVLSAFELARGYCPSLLGISARIVTIDLLNAHKEQQATRALQRLMKTRPIDNEPPPFLRCGQPVFYYYKSSKQNERNEWKAGHITTVEPHYTIVKSDTTGRTSKIAYEDIRMRPDSKFTRELMDGTVEHYLESASNPHTTERGESIQMGDERNTSVRALTTAENQTSSEPDHQTDRVRASMDIGLFAEIGNDSREICTTLSTSEQELLETLEKRIGARQINKSELGNMPEWLTNRAMDAEIQQNWALITEETMAKDLPSDANILSTHFVFKIKKDEDGIRKLKARLVVHGNKDVDKDEVRKDAVAADMNTTRLILALGMVMHFSFGVADIKGAFMQSGPAHRELYIVPPASYMTKKRVYWKLLSLAYGICDAGRQWQKTSDFWMIDELGMKRLIGAHQVFTKRDACKNLVLLVAKTTDDFLAAGTMESIIWFFDEMKKRFTVGKSIIEKKMMFNGCVIEIGEDKSVTLTMNDYLNRLSPIELSRSRRKEAHLRATCNEIAEYRTLAGTLMYLGTAVLPQASFVTSLMQRRINELRVAHLIDANTMLKDLLALKPQLRFPFIERSFDSPLLLSFSDASHGGKEFDYGQTGGITGLRLTERDHTDGVFYAISWTSAKQRRVSHSSFGAEIIAAAEVDERGYDIRETIREIFPHSRVKHELVLDSKALFDTITTLHECREYRLRRTVSRIRDAFESRELDVVRWVPGRMNMADALTKRNPFQWKNLNRLLQTGIWDLDLRAGKAHDGSVWI